MNWYVLRQRRHEGPFSLEDVKKGLKDGHWTRGDFLLSEENFEKGNLNYQRLSEVLGLQDQNPSKKENPKAREVSQEILKAVGNLEAAEIVGAQTRVRQEQGNREEARPDASQVLYVQTAATPRSSTRFHAMPTLGIVLALTGGIVFASHYFLVHSKPAPEEKGLEITSVTRSPSKQNHHVRKPASVHAQEPSKRIMPTNPQDFDDRRSREEDVRNDDDRDIDPIDRDAPASELDRLKRRKARRTEEVGDPSWLDGMDIDLRQRDRRPGAYEDHGDEEERAPLNDNDRLDDRRHTDTNDDEETENQEAIE